MSIVCVRVFFKYYLGRPWFSVFCFSSLPRMAGLIFWVSECVRACTSCVRSSLSNSCICFIHCRAHMCTLLWAIGLRIKVHFQILELRIELWWKKSKRKWDSEGLHCVWTNWIKQMINYMNGMQKPFVCGARCVQLRPVRVHKHAQNKTMNEQRIRRFLLL